MKTVVGKRGHHSEHRINNSDAIKLPFHKLSELSHSLFHTHVRTYTRSSRHKANRTPNYRQTTGFVNPNPTPLTADTHTITRTCCGISGGASKAVAGVSVLVPRRGVLKRRRRCCHVLRSSTHVLHGACCRHLFARTKNQFDGHHSDKQCSPTKSCSARWFNKTMKCTRVICE
jgi:hypothetical protein